MIFREKQIVKNMKTLRFACICMTVMFIAWTVMNATINISENNVEYKTILEENKQINLLQEEDCIKRNGVEYCDKFKSNWKCREIKSLMMDFAEKDKNDTHERVNYSSSYYLMVNKYNKECLVDSE